MQALELVRSKPGITIPEIAEQLSIEPNYLYRVMPKLVADGQVQREGQGWHPAPAMSGGAFRRAAAGRPPDAASPADGSDQAESLDRLTLLGQLAGRGVDPRAGEVVDLQPLDDLVPPAASR